MAEQPYNPLDKLNLGKSVAEALLDKEADSLGEIGAFEGAGIYAIYYDGPFKPYQLMAARNAEHAEWPIYIGKAIPSGARKGGALFSEITGRPLWIRLRDHAESVKASSNLDIADFECRYLTIDDIWIPLGETLLIAHFKPLWNLYLEGFGNHDPGAGRYNGLQPLWDVLHPGRPWAARCQARPQTAKVMAERVAEFLEANEPPTDPRLKFSPEPNLENL